MSGSVITNTLDYLEKQIEEKDKEIERLNNKINKFVEDFDDYLFSNPLVSLDDTWRHLDYILMLERDMPKDFKFIATIKGMVEELKGSNKE